MTEYTVVTLRDKQYLKVEDPPFSETCSCSKCVFDTDPLGCPEDPESGHLSCVTLYDSGRILIDFHFENLPEKTDGKN